MNWDHIWEKWYHSAEFERHKQKILREYGRDAKLSTIEIFDLCLESIVNELQRLRGEFGRR